MAIPTDPEGKAALARVVGKRLKASRRAAGLSQAKAAEALNHKGITQVSLAEDGERLPPLLDLYKYAELYSVPMDFLVGRINDPIAEATELGQGMMVRAVSHSITGLFDKFANAVAEHTSVCLSSLRQDRADLVEMIRVAAEAEEALKRLRALNPEFDDLRGGAKVQSLLLQIAGIGRRIEARTQAERAQFDMIDKALQLEQAEPALEQFQLSFSMGEPA